MKTFNELLEDIYASQYKIKKVQSQNPTTGDWEWHDRKVRTKRIDFKNSKMGGKPSQEDEDMKEESTPYWKKPSFNKRMSQMAKQERREREQKEAEKKTVKEENMTIDEQINEVLSKDATAGDWIHDFVHSDNPKFDGKSKEKRKQMALAAYYAKQQNEEIELEEGDLSVRTLYNKFADAHVNGHDTKSTEKAIKKVHGDEVLKHMKKAANANAKGDMDKEENHFDNAQNAARKTDRIGGTVGRGRSEFMRKRREWSEEVELIDEISDKTLDSYLSAARKDREHNKVNKTASDTAQKVNAHERDKKRIAGMNKAKSYLTPGTAGHAKNQARKAVNEETAGESYEDAAAHLEKAKGAKENTKEYHFHMSNHHEAMGHWHTAKGRHLAADKEFNKAEGHHELGVDLKEETMLDEKITVVRDPNKVRSDAPQGRGDVYVPTAPVPDKKYIKGTPENKALRASRKPINGHPTNVKEGTMKSFKEMMQSLDELSKGTLGSYIKKAKGEAIGAANAMGMTRQSTNVHQSAEKKMIKRASGVNKAVDRLTNEEVELQEANHREYASQGKMHPDMVKHMSVGQEHDYYEHGTGDKVSGKVMHKSATEVHMKQTHDSYDPKKKGTVHKFKISDKLDEDKKEDPPFDGPYTKSPGTVKDKSGAVHTPMSRARDLARQAMKKQMKEEIDVILEATDSHEYADGEMSIHELKQIKAHSEWILEMLKPDTDMPEWVQAKITLAADYLSTACDYLHVELNEELKGNQHKIDKNKNGKVDSADFKMLRGEECPECHKAPCECDSMKEDTYSGLEKMKKMGLPTAARSSHPRGVNIDTVEGWDHPHDAVKKKEVKEETDVDTRSLSFKDFMSQLNEYTPGPGGVTRVQGRSYGAQYRDPEGEDDADEKKKQVAKSEPAVKRGRGRPAGSKSGANQKVTTGRKGSGVDYTGYKLHLPNSNR